ncbi:hypothetical protein VDP97_07770 [Xanthomonas campestris pv. campestris]|uniref:hypothetical protein n=2 Tax=Xanthomonas campestris TaxID=339 RepID=UPI000A8935FA|nr:hypothetical protein [Xanthomonas campestris]MBF9172304.1 hypothetical protein [Xanthomonas campestris pv. campestris]MCC5049910.1 hypothetical protein [Xanthomonas campestris pv. aberrans]MCD0251209.1 hypothetical protein [Xanthomonas campestris pv. campestris]MCD0263891.1 hypothetical protein [Xanthomonas campestris pv. campestris]MCD0272203.1 hypothetical protein [Xanthomonas campestris pv. campestris]
MIDPLRASAIDCAMTARPLGGGAHGVFELFVRIADVTQLSGWSAYPSRAFELSDASRLRKHTLESNEAAFDKPLSR